MIQELPLLPATAGAFFAAGFGCVGQLRNCLCLPGECSACGGAELLWLPYSRATLQHYTSARKQQRSRLRFGQGKSPLARRERVANSPLEIRPVLVPPFEHAHREDTKARTVRNPPLWLQLLWTLAPSRCKNVS
jgi:hypothetical protein